MKFYIATSDKSSHILKAFAWLFDKYCPDEEIEILGYSEFPQLPERYKLISLAERQNDFSEWSMNIYNYMKDIKDEFIIFGLDDFLPTREIDKVVLEYMMMRMAIDKRIGRYELGSGHRFHEYVIPYLSPREYGEYQYLDNALYRISTQFSVWRTEYLLRFLNHNWNPFDFEIEGTKLSTKDGNLIVASRQTAWDWVNSGAISSRHPDKINVLGLKKADVESMISEGIFDRNKLQLGMRIGDNPPYER